MSDPTMPNFEPVHRPALTSVTPLSSDRIRLMPLPEGTVLLVMGTPDHAGPLTDSASRLGLSLRANSPDQWYLVGDVPVSPAALADFRNSLPDGLTLVDQSHGRVRIAVEGPAVEAVLAKGTGVDLSRFHVGDATNTLIGHITTHMARTAGDRFELMPLRGFAESLWHDLETMAAEYADHHP